MKISELREDKKPLQKAGGTLAAIQADLMLKKPIIYDEFDKARGRMLVPVPTTLTYDELDFFKKMAYVALKKHVPQLHPQENPKLLRLIQFIYRNVDDEATKYGPDAKIKPSRFLVFKVDEL